MRFVTSTAFLLIWCTLGICSETAATISGRVVDSAGTPVGSVMVDITEAGKTLRGHRPRGEHQTAADGTFSIQNVPLGTYLIETSKTDEDYPNTALAFYSNLKVPTVTVSSALPNQNITVVLGPKCGFLEVAEVVDAVTGASVSAAVKLRRLDSGYWVSISSTVKNICVPALTAATVEVSAPGYATWYYTGSTDPAGSGTISLQPGQEMVISVALQPTN